MIDTLDSNRPGINEVRQRFRKEIPVAEKWAYFDHAAVGPIPTCGKLAIEKWLSGAVLDGDTVWPQWSATAERLRKSGQQLVSAQKDEIAIVPNTSTGISVVAEGLRWQAGGNVVYFENEFPSNALPWLNLERRGVEVRRLSVQPDQTLDLESLAKAIDHRTRLVTLSWVGYASGYRVDLERVCDIVKAGQHPDCLLFVDAIQGLGVFPLSVADLPIDFLAADGHKWMLGPEGAGLLYIRQQNLDLLDPIIVGWGSSRDAANFDPSKLDFRPAATRYEIGSANMVGIHSFAASLEFLLSLGCHLSDSPVARVVLENVAYMSERLRRVGAVVHTPCQSNNQSGIVPFDLPGQDHGQIRHEMLSAGIALSVRHGHMRASTHGYNDASDIDRLVDFVSCKLA